MAAHPTASATPASGLPPLAVDLITFFDPSFWGLADEAAVVAYGQAEPRPFWDRILDTLVEAGVTGIELTFSPFGWEDMVAAYGSVAGCAAALDARGLAIATGFFADVAIEGGLDDADKVARHLARGEELARFLAQFGAKAMVMGLPMRTSWDANPPAFVDFAAMRIPADFCNQLGAIALRHGVSLALHTEAHSIFSLARDIDLLLMLTDPVYVGFCPDSAQIAISGSDPVAVVARHVERLVATHWKDAKGPAPVRVPIDDAIHLEHRKYFCALGDGIVDWHAWRDLMVAARYDGWTILEIDAVPDPVAEVKKSVAFLAENVFNAQD